LLLPSAEILLGRPAERASPAVRKLFPLCPGRNPKLRQAFLLVICETARLANVHTLIITLFPYLNKPLFFAR
jgi:hypothetical protein